MEDVLEGSEVLLDVSQMDEILAAKKALAEASAFPVS
jgi:hypothetical protein